MSYTVQPITDRTWIGSKAKIASQFNTSWSKTIALLTKEIDLLGGRDFVIQMDINAEDLKLNGELRASARPATDAVIVAFESKHGPLTYRCDRFYTNYYGQGPDWQHNVRGIALTLERLRDVDRYGATETGQQYTGFKALGAGRVMPSSHMTSEQATLVLREQATRRIGPDEAAASSLPDLYKIARRAAHPDHNSGDQTLWDQVEQAGLVLGVGR